MPPPPCRRGDRAAAACVLLLVILTGGFLLCAAAAWPAPVVHGGAVALPSRLFKQQQHAWRRSRVTGHDDGAVVSRFNFVAEGKPPWSQRPSPIVVTYAFSPEATIKYPPPAEVRAAFQRAFARWAQVIPVSFVGTDDYDGADVKVGFYTGYHGDGDPFDGPLRVLAHSSPEDGEIHLDASERWAVLSFDSAGGAAIDLEYVATHEIGHILGLDHSASPGAVMNPTIGTGKKKANLTLDDIQGAQQLYGANPDFNNISSLYDDPPENSMSPLENSTSPPENSMSPLENSMSPPARSSCWFVRVVIAGVVILVTLGTTHF